jgi:hypothetical protein
MTFEGGVQQGGPSGQPQNFQQFSPGQGPNSGYPAQSPYPNTPGSFSQYSQYGGMASPQGQGNFGAPYQQHPQSAGGYSRPPPQSQQWPQQQQGNYGSNYGYQG